MRDKTNIAGALTGQEPRNIEAEFRAIFELSAVGKAHGDPLTGRLLLVNDRLCEITGYSRDELLQKTFMDITHPDDRDRNIKVFEKAEYQESSTCQSEKRYIRKDGSVVWVAVSGTLLYSLDGQPYHFAVDISDINERKLAEEKLRESEEQYRLLFNTLIEGFCIIEVLFDANNRPIDYRFLEINPSFEALTGLANAKGKLMRELAPEHEEHWFDIYGKVALTGTPVRFVNEAKALNRWYDVNACRVDGPSNRVAILFNDITDRVKAERRLALIAETTGQLLASESPQKVISSICHNVMDFLDCHVFLNFLVDEETGRLHLNACAGLSEKEKIEWLNCAETTSRCAVRGACCIVAENLSESLDPHTDLIKSYGILAYACHPLISKGHEFGVLCFGTRTRTRFSEDDLLMMKTVADHVAITFERKRTEEALRRAHDEQEKRVIDRTKELRATVESLQREMAERKRAEELLFQSEERYRKVVESQTDSICRITAEGEYLFVNDVYCRIFGKSKDELMGSTWHPVVVADDLPIIQERLGLLSPLNPVVVIENRVYFASGEVHWMQFINSGIFDKEGRLLEIQVVGRDISERKQAEEELRNYARRLIEMEEGLRRKLAADLHDEIGTELSVLGMNLTVIGNGITDPMQSLLKSKVTDSGKLIENINRNVRGLMNSLRPPGLNDFGLLAAIHWHADLFSKRTGIKVSVQADDPFPRMTPEQETALFRISQEALMNAAKHANTQDVTVKLIKTESMVMVVVEDRGIGFLPAVSSQMLNGFRWGLKIMRERAELVGGKLQIDSAPGNGTTVSVCLPLEGA